AAGLPARGRLPDHLCACAQRLDVAPRVFHHGRGRGDRAHLADEGGACGGGELRAHRGLLHLCRARHRLALGRADVGHLLAVGSPADFRADPALPVFWVHVLAIVGVVNVPIIHYSVTWWNSLHQAPSVMRLGEPTMPPSMLVPLLMMLLGFTLFFGALLLVRVRGEVLSRERTASWIREALQP